MERPSNTHILKLKAQLAQVEAGKAEQAYQIAQKLEEVARLEAAMEAADAKIKELKELIG